LRAREAVRAPPPGRWRLPWYGEPCGGGEVYGEPCGGDEEYGGPCGGGGEYIQPDAVG